MAAMENRLNEYVFHASTEVTPTFGSLRPPLLDDQLIQTQLLGSTLQHTLLDTTLRNEAEDIDLLRLANTMCAVHRLQVVSGIYRRSTIMMNEWYSKTYSSLDLRRRVSK